MVVRRKVFRTRAEWDLVLQNVKSKIQKFKSDLSIPSEKIDTLNTDADSYRAWLLALEILNDGKKSVTEFVIDLFKGDDDENVPQSPTVDIGSPVVPLKRGIETRTKKLFDWLETQDNFTNSIGLDLGFLEEVPDKPSPDTLTAGFKFEAYTGYQVRFPFSKQGQNGMQFQYRIKGETAWTKVNAASSPFVLNVTPDPNGQAITLEVQSVLLKKNEPVGQLSDLKTVIARA